LQAQILDLMRELKAASGAAIILITHDLGVVAEVCDEVAVMYAGEIVERAPVDELFAHPSIPTPSACSARSRGSTAAPRISPPSRAWSRT
jgi:ABC-type dipeptide/oligopeptide/nickel transport system ATPase component